MDNTLPHLKKTGSRVLFYGKRGSFLTDPESERWDVVLLMERESVSKFMEFAQNEDYLKGVGHRTVPGHCLPVKGNKQIVR